MLQHGIAQYNALYLIVLYDTVCDYIVCVVFIKALAPTTCSCQC